MKPIMVACHEKLPLANDEISLQIPIITKRLEIRGDGAILRSKAATEHNFTMSSTMRHTTTVERVRFG
jgi:hypothetical protein